jgi:hypothetical protein
MSVSTILCLPACLHQGIQDGQNWPQMEESWYITSAIKNTAVTYRYKMSYLATTNHETETIIFLDVLPEKHGRSVYILFTFLTTLRICHEVQDNQELTNVKKIDQLPE